MIDGLGMSERERETTTHSSSTCLSDTHVLFLIDSLCNGLVKELVCVVVASAYMGSEAIASFFDDLDDDGDDDIGCCVV